MTQAHENTKTAFIKNHESGKVAFFFSTMVLTALVVIVSEQSWMKAISLISCFITAWAFMDGLIGILHTTQRNKQS